MKKHVFEVLEVFRTCISLTVFSTSVTMNAVTQT